MRSPPPPTPSRCAHARPSRTQRAPHLIPVPHADPLTPHHARAPETLLTDVAGSALAPGGDKRHTPGRLPRAREPVTPRTSPPGHCRGRLTGATLRSRDSLATRRTRRPSVVASGFWRSQRPIRAASDFGRCSREIVKLDRGRASCQLQHALNELVANQPAGLTPRCSSMSTRSEPVTSVAIGELRSYPLAASARPRREVRPTSFETGSAAGFCAGVLGEHLLGRCTGCGHR